MDSALAEEARVLALRCSPAGDRLRSWSSVEESAREEAFADWPVAGPRTVQWCLGFLKREGRALELHRE
eukprot:71172-Lingulodinium_polyedra.AAC.1